jgi:hypothetical protein
MTIPEGVTRISIVRVEERRWLRSCANFASGQIFLHLTSSATACLKCTALAFLIVSLVQSATTLALQASALSRLLYFLPPFLVFLTSWVCSLYH